MMVSQETKNTNKMKTVSIFHKRWKEVANLFGVLIKENGNVLSTTKQEGRGRGRGKMSD